MSSFPTVHEAETMRMELTQLATGADLEVVAPPGEEAVALLVTGRIESSSGHAERSSPFDSPLAGWFLPPAASLVLHAEIAGTLAVVTSKGAGLDGSDGDPVFLERAEAEVRGRGEFERSVATLVDFGCGSRRLIAGQTTHASGGWSSYPPHRHDGSGGESYFEEIYHYRFDPEAGFGFQGIYGGDDLSEAHLIRDGDILTIERGYHPVCAAPGYRFTYLWALCGPADRFQQVDDPIHEWVAAK